MLKITKFLGKCLEMTKTMVTEVELVVGINTNKVSSAN